MVILKLQKSLIKVNLQKTHCHSSLRFWNNTLGQALLYILPLWIFAHKSQIMLRHHYWIQHYTECTSENGNGHRFLLWYTPYVHHEWIVLIFNFAYSYLSYIRRVWNNRRVWKKYLKSLSSALLISRYILGLGQRGHCCFCATCPNRKMYLEIWSANEGALKVI